MKLKYLIPNFFTACSLISGIFALKYIGQESFLTAGWLIAFSMFCDGLDGKLARVLQASSRFGKIFDTISDFFAFGIVPAVLAYICVLQKFGIWGIIAVMIYAGCGAFRLTRFMRKSVVSAKKESFTGLPIPAAAGFIASYLILNYQLGQQVVFPGLFFVFILFVSFLMISKIEYIPFEPKLISNKLILLLGIIVTLVIFIIFPYYFYFLSIFIYVLHGLIIHFSSH